LIAGSWRVIDDSSGSSNTYNMRRFVAPVASLALVLGLFLAPFTHVHMGGGPDHHSTLVHSHFSSDALTHSEHVSIDDNDDHHAAAQLDLFKFPPHTPFPAIDLPESGFVSFVVQVAPNRCAVPTACSHDPPIERYPGFRAPPV
jgi:hypothetical protein